jgi:hypothetical protein
MSTDMMNYNREDLIEEIRDLNPDMLDEFTEDEIADCVLDIAMKLGTTSGRVIDYTLIKFSDRGNKDYQIKVSNTHGGFVSVSDDCCTGVSKTLFYPFYITHGEAICGLASLVEMINEAWYLCKN